MKFLFVFLFLVPFCYSQTTLDSEVLPDAAKPSVSPVEDTIQEAKPVEETLPEKVETEVTEVKKSVSNSREKRANSTGTLMLGYQLITSWIPSKKVVSFTQYFSDKWAVEGEFSWGSLNSSFIGHSLGSVSEQRYTLQARRFVGNSFNFSFGAVLSSFTAEVGGDVLDNLGHDLNARISSKNLGVTGGIGNRWIANNGFSFGIDWVRINIPVVQTNTDDSAINRIGSSAVASNVKSVVRTFNRIPTFVLLGLNVGYTF